MGRLVPSDKPWTMKDLIDAGITTCSSVKHGIKLLAKGKERLRSPIKIEISRASEGAIESIEKVGGEITTVHYNRLALRALLKPEKFDVIPKRARPPPKLMQYYTDYDNRGYLSPEMQLKNLKKNLGKEEETDIADKQE
jgi:large subunit ribosomal protein L15